MDKIKPGNLEVHWPEASCLLSLEEMDHDSHEPDYNAVVTVETLPRSANRKSGSSGRADCYNRPADLEEA
jgi:hypothetical protein